MPFTTFAKFTTITASEVEGNFDHVGAGNMLPQGGTGLTPTTGVYNLGSDAARWATTYLKNINLGAGGELKKCMNLIAETTLSVAAASIEFTGLNGDTDKIYIVRGLYSLTTTSSHVQLIFNGDSASANYGKQQLWANSTGASSGRNTAQLPYIGGVDAGLTTTSRISNGELTIYAKTGNERLMIGTHTENSDNTFLGYIINDANVWNNTASTITSIKCFLQGGVNFLINTNIQLWAPR